jgi:5-methyltetrahydropteroyltriglutamate--homocysteine methyltransferase
VPRPVVTGEISYIGQSELQRDIGNLKAALATNPQVSGFLPVVAPASAIPNAKNEFYRDEEAYLFGLAEALKTEYRAIIDAGLDLQVDDAGLPIAYEKMVPPMPSRPGEFQPEPLTDSVREPLDSYGSCHRMKAAAFH